MQCYMSQLMSDYDATKIVIVCDDAMIAEHQRPEFSPVTTSKDDDLPKRPSFKNCPTKNSAPRVPARKTSMDDLSLSKLIGKSGVSRSRRKRSASMDDELLADGIKSIGSNPLPTLVERRSSSSSSASSRESRHALFDDIFRDVDQLLKNSAYE
eukprot:CAMPEP_0113646038 /NCGR_PEP_ID=MMETSP0017_2-20120614/24296_1 /TAXON_ID=2856 /ORGANISM="Cylindrotheca closterium" /LENGTH=153 /DNA_ID=CAMNT_0000557865 /DNA_START=74 /DNA_END=535 /DNA_ORIENTATION=- /assembly_acc=CAM_ASM_000147